MTSRFTDLLEKLGVPMDAQLFELALTHRSWAYENGGVPTNERLEFLGDAVLQVVVTEYLYLTFPDQPEGRLAKIRAGVVNTHALADVARSLDVGRLIKLGKGEIATGGDDKTSILADTMEALFGAARLSGDQASAERLIRHLMVPRIDAAAAVGAGLDWKTSLQELSARLGAEPPTYEITGSGPDHQRVFVAEAIVAGERFPGEPAGSKREAEILAASRAFTVLSHRESDEPDPDA